MNVKDFISFVWTEKYKWEIKQKNLKILNPQNPSAKYLHAETMLLPIRDDLCASGGVLEFGNGAVSSDSDITFYDIYTIPLDTGVYRLTFCCCILLCASVQIGTQQNESFIRQKT